jgi:hypothetical protein
LEILQQDEFAVDLHNIQQEQQQQQLFYHSHASHASQQHHHHPQHPQHIMHHPHPINPRIRHQQHQQQYPSQYDAVHTMNSHNGDGQSSVFRDLRVLQPVYTPGSQFVRPPTDGPIRNVFRGIDRVSTLFITCLCGHHDGNNHRLHDDTRRKFMLHVNLFEQALSHLFL